MSRQSFEHATQQSHTVILQIKAFRVLCPSQPCMLALSGSDCCERTNADLGGHGKIGGRRRNFNVLEAVDMAGDITQLQVFGGDADASQRLEYGSGNRHHVYDYTLHDNPTADDADLTDYSGVWHDMQLVASFEAGLVRARAAAVRLGQGLTGKMQVPPRAKPLTGQQLMAKPWLG